LRALGLKASADMESMKAGTASTAAYLGAAAQVAGGVGAMYRLRTAGSYGTANTGY
jgi:hypothetical protein